MKLSKQQLQRLQKILEEGIPTAVALSQVWKDFYESEMIGLIQGKKLVFETSDLSRIEGFLDINGYPRTSTEYDFSSRAHAAESLPSEKMATTTVTHDRVLVKSINEFFELHGVTFPAFHGIEFKVEQALQLDGSQVVLIENLELFLKAEDYKQFTTLLNNDALLIYRGGTGIFSTKASIEFLQKFSGERIGFFDFDPAGLCRLGHKNLDSVILPDFECIGLNQLKSGSREDVFYQQLPKYQHCLEELILGSSELTDFAGFMKEAQLAVMQEKLFASNSELIKVPEYN
ncbi:hypothetical protein JCM30760_10120 [Thiomicrorhabdus hydrogeniphila]